MSAKQPFVFIGNTAEIAGIAKLDTFGQRIHLEANLAAEAIRGHCALLPAGLFDAAFEGIDYKRYPSPEAQRNAPPEFHAAYHDCLITLQRLQCDLEADVILQALNDLFTPTPGAEPPQAQPEPQSEPVD